MNVFETIQKLLIDSNINYSTSEFKNKQIINLKIAIKETIFSYLVKKLNETFGRPKFVDSYYGYIWSIDGKFLSFNIIEEGYNTEKISLYIFNKLPLSKRISYTEYKKIDTLITKTLEKYNFNCDDFIHYMYKQYLYFGHGENFECAISLKRNHLQISYSKKEQINDGSYRIKQIFNKRIKLDQNNLIMIEKVLSDNFTLLN